MRHRLGNRDGAGQVAFGMSDTSIIPVLTVGQKTAGDLYGNIGKVTTREQASEYMEALCAWHAVTHGLSDGEAGIIQRHNVGYWSGYSDTETGARIRDLAADDACERLTLRVFGET
jgi:hypothetical protein